MRLVDHKPTQQPHSSQPSKQPVQLFRLGVFLGCDVQHFDPALVVGLSHTTCNSGSSSSVSSIVAVVAVVLAVGLCSGNNNTSSTCSIASTTTASIAVAVQLLYD